MNHPIRSVLLFCLFIVGCATPVANTVKPTTTLERHFSPTASSTTTTSSTVSRPPSSMVVTAKVIEASVNVRSNPSTTAKIIGKLKKDNTITLSGRNAEESWYQTTIPDSTVLGWVFAQTLQVTSGDAHALSIVGENTSSAANAIVTTTATAELSATLISTRRPSPTATLRRTATPFPTYAPIVFPTYPPIVIPTYAPVVIPTSPPGSGKT